jgi:hypothetical protein
MLSQIYIFVFIHYIQFTFLSGTDCAPASLMLC